jgi:DNA adenine methylase
MKTPIRYAGGKTKAINTITPFVADYNKIISPFIGGGSLEVHWASMGKEVIGHDIFDALVNFWNVLLNRNNELADKLAEITPTDAEYRRIKEILMCWDKTQEMLAGWKTDFYIRENPIQLDELTAAAYYFFNHNSSYGPGYLGWGSKIYLNDKSWNKMVNIIRTFSCPNLSVHRKSYEQAIEDNPNEFLYLDPPYFMGQDSDNKMHSAIYPMKNIPVHHDGFNHEQLRDLLKKHKGNFVLSYNNCETIREYYSEFEQLFPKWHYSMGNGETRIGKNRKELQMVNAKDSHEILIVKR